MKTSRILLSMLLAAALGLAACGASEATPTAEAQATQTAPANGVISGVVWHDLCAYSGGVAPIPLPLGCVPNSVGGAIANGVRDAGEQGIPGVQILLHAGDCSSAALFTSATDGNGQYVFSNLAAGSYCVTIDANASPNNLLIAPGVWSHPTALMSIVQLSDALPAGGSLPFDFGWDFQNLPAAAAPIATIGLMPTTGASLSVTQTPAGIFFAVDVSANCRSGPDTAYPVVTSYLPGQYLTPVGKNADGTWWYVQINSTKNCWISGTVGHITSTSAGLPVIATTPLATGTVTVTPTGVAGSDTTPPVLEDAYTLYPSLSYPDVSCGGNFFNVGVRASDDNLASVWVTYRFVESGSAGAWVTLSANESSSGMSGFNYDLSAPAATALGTDDGVIEYQFHAKDVAGNTTDLPAGSYLQITVQYCP